MIKLDQAIAIHQVLIEKFGGASGIKDRGALEASLNRPYATFDKKDLYPSPVDKAAAILESILINHPFIDGNKRTGYVLMRMTIMECGLDIKASQNEKYDFVIQVTEGKQDISRIKEWITSHIEK